MTERLPVESVIPEVLSALANPGAAVLVAAPGAGKTTVVPLRLLDAQWLEGRIIVLEPRRIAARAAAARLAWHLGESVGRTVGYRVRFDTKVSDRTRIEVVTEGVLTRLFAADPGLEGYGAVLFDEFHERSIAGDVGLAMTLRARTVLRPELRVLVMSATIDPAPIGRLLGDAPVIEAPGKIHPVEIRHRPPPPGSERRFETHVALTVREVLADEPGDVLVFLPGVGEIRRVADLLGTAGVSVLSLHGSLPLEEQAKVLNPGRERRVVLATSIAETSLTIPGVRVVIDGGRMRVPRFSPRTGMTRLETVRVSRASADQRRGRAGRTEPGVCYRLWGVGEEAGLVAFNTPEILAADLTPLALDLAASGVDEPGELGWLDSPAPAALAQARGLLTMLGALDDRGRLTGEGRSMASLPIHPRLAHMALRARAAGASGAAAALAALLGERDLARRPASGELPDVDLRLRVEALNDRRAALPIEVDRSLAERLRAEVREWRRRLAVEGPADPDLTGQLLAWAYPDRIAQRRPGQTGRFLLRNGRGASIPPNQPLARAEFLAVADVDDTGADSRILLAAPIEGAVLDRLIDEQGEWSQVVEWDGDRRTIRAAERLTLGAIVVSERSVSEPDRALALAAIAEGLRRDGLDRLAWTDQAIRLRQRMAFLHGFDPDWPDVGDAALQARLYPWLDASLSDRYAVAELDPTDLLTSPLSWDRRAALDRLAPERYRVPTGSQVSIDYGDPFQPVLAVRLQEMFGETSTPTIAGGRIQLAVHLLSPAGRPLQVTRDLAGFWRTSYHDVRRR